MDQLLSMKMFCRIAELGSFKAAALDLGLSVVKASRLIGDLESQLNQRLLQRTTRAVSLTALGGQYYERCKPALDQLEEAAELITSQEGPVQGRVKVVLGFAEAVPLLSRRLFELQQLHPALEIELRFEERVINLGAEGIDLAVLPEPFIQSENVVARYLMRSQMVLCAAPGYLARADRLGGPQDLASHACIGFNHGPMTRRWALFHHGQRVEVPVRCVFASNHLQLITDACRRGQGVALLLETQVREALDSGQLIQVLPEWTGHEIEYFVVYQSRKLMPRAVRLVLDEVLALYPAAPHASPSLNLAAG